MLTMKDTGLVNGVPLASTPLVTIKALGGFYDEQNVQRHKGEVFQCSERFARYLQGINRAERVAEPPSTVTALAGTAMILPPAEEETHAEPIQASEEKEEVVKSRRRR